MSMTSKVLVCSQSNSLLIKSSYQKSSRLNYIIFGIDMIDTITTSLALIQVSMPQICLSSSMIRSLAIKLEHFTILKLLDVYLKIINIFNYHKITKIWPKRPKSKKILINKLEKVKIRWNYLIHQKKSVLKSKVKINKNKISQKKSPQKNCPSSLQIILLINRMECVRIEICQNLWIPPKKLGKSSNQSI